MRIRVCCNNFRVPFVKVRISEGEKSECNVLYAPLIWFHAADVERVRKICRFLPRNSVNLVFYYIRLFKVKAQATY